MHSRKFPFSTLFDIQLRLSAFQPTPIRSRHSMLSTLFPTLIFSLLFSLRMPLPPFPPLSLSVCFCFSLSACALLCTYIRTWLPGHVYPLDWLKVYCPCGLKSPCEKISLAASESTTKLDINLLHYPVANPMFFGPPSVHLCLFLQILSRKLTYIK